MAKRTWVSLLRAVNVGSHNRLNMPEFRKALVQNGFEDVRTLVQSGNVVAASAHTSAGKVASAVGAVLEEHFGIVAPVIVRTPSELRAVRDWCPFPDAVDRPAALNVVHLDTEPDAARLAELLGRDWSPDRLAARGRELVISYAGTMHDSRLQYASTLKSLGAQGTARNWRTLTGLIDLCES